METRNHPYREAWNKGKLVGQKATLKPKDIWAIRIHLQNANAEQQVTGALQTNFGRRPKVGKGRQAGRQPTRSNGRYWISNLPYSMSITYGRYGSISAGG